MKSFKYILFLLLIAVIGLAMYIAVQPNSFVLMVNRNIKASADVIYETIADNSVKRNNTRFSWFKNGVGYFVRESYGRLKFTALDRV